LRKYKSAYAEQGSDFGENVRLHITRGPIALPVTIFRLALNARRFGLRMV
jgi:hypothetical protein